MPPTLRPLLLATALLLSTLTASAAVYRYVDENDRVQFSDQPPPAPTTRSAPKHRATPPPPPAQASATTTAPPPVENLTPPQSAGVKEELRRLLESRDFEALNRKLAALQQQAEATPASEDSLMVAYWAFEANRPDYAGLLDEWARKTPDAYQPYAARSRYYHGQGWAARGNKWSSETSREQFATMARHFKRAVTEAREALTRNERCIPAYDVLLEIAKHERGTQAAETLFARARAANPDSLALARAYLGNLTPRWGGSLQVMAGFVEQYRPRFTRDPRWRLLEGDEFNEAGDLEYLAKNYDDALELYTQAVETGPHHQALQGRAKTLQKLKRYPEALKDIDRAIALYPERGEYHYRRANILEDMERYIEARSSLQQAERLAPGEESHERLRTRLAKRMEIQGYQAQKMDRPADALAQYTAALETEGPSAGLHYRRARALVDLHRYDEALTDVREAIRLDPDDANPVKLADWLLAQRGEWPQIIALWDAYIARHPENSDAYMERGGAYYHKGDLRAAVDDAKRAADLGNPQGQQTYERFRKMVR